MEMADDAYGTRANKESYGCRGHECISRKKAIDTSKISFTSLTEGLSIQTLHIGRYDQVGPVLKQLHEIFMPQHGYSFNGKHHEIYLSNPQQD